MPSSLARQPSRPWLAALSTLITLVVVASCSATDTSAPGRAARATLAPRPDFVAQPAMVSAPFDLHGVMKQVHFAYRPEGAGFTGGHRTYAVHASAEGLAFTPASNDAEPVRFVTASIGRGDERRAPVPFAARVEQDGHLAIARGEAVEHLRNDEDGVEQSFAFAERPHGEGDLVVRLRVSGEEYAGRTEGGQHFVDPRSGLGVRYGAATFVDARGERTAIEVAWTGAELAITVPEAVVDEAAYPAVIDPVVSAELDMDTPVQSNTTGESVAPAVAFDGTNWLVAWATVAMPNGR